LPDHVMRAIADKGGVVALHFMSQIVKPGRHKATFGELMAQFEYVARLIGPEHMALGPDFAYPDPRMWENFGVTIPYSFTEGVEDITRMPNLVRGLVALGFTDDEVLGIIGGNLLRLFQQVRASATPSPARPASNGAIGIRTAGTTPF
jgi:membrane dipeptidase